MSQSASLLFHPVFANARVLDVQVHGRESEDLAIGRLQQAAHVLPPHLESATRDAGNHIVVLALLVALRAQALHARHLVARSARVPDVLHILAE